MLLLILIRAYWWSQQSVNRCGLWKHCTFLPKVPWTEVEQQPKWRTTTRRLCSVCFTSQIILGFSHGFLFPPTRKWHLLDPRCKSSELFISVVDVCLHVCWVHECVFIPGQNSVQHHPPTMTSVLTLSFLPLFCKPTIGLFVGQCPDPLPSIRPPADCREFWSTQWASADDKVLMYPEHLQILLFKITLDEQHSVQLLNPTSQ